MNKEQDKIESATKVTADYNIDAFLAKRSDFIKKVNKIMVTGKDYHVIQGRKSLAKGGAEKIASIFGWTANFQRDNDSRAMLGDQEGLVCFTCNLYKDKFDMQNYVGQGRGAATLTRNNNDPNKTLKMAQKSAFIDAVLRTSGLSDFFTQDLGPEDEGSGYYHVQPYASVTSIGALKYASQSQIRFIKALRKRKISPI